MSDRTNHLFFHIFIPVLSCKIQQHSSRQSNQTTNHSAAQKAPPLSNACLFSSNISALFAAVLQNGNSLSFFFFKATHLFEAWIIFIFLPCVLLFVVLMFAPCKHVNFNSDNKTWWFCLCCGSSFDGGCLGKRRDHLWSRVFHGNTLLSKERWRSDRTHKDTLNLLMRP